MWYALIIFVGLIFLAFIILKLGHGPVYYRHLKPAEFENHLSGFLSQMTSGSMIFFRHEGSERFIQFFKKESESNDVLHFGFPDAPWSRDYFELMVQMVEKKSLQYQINPSKELVHRFLDIDLMAGSLNDTSGNGSREGSL